jgi:cytochrome c peroxidase
MSGSLGGRSPLLRRRYSAAALMFLLSASACRGTTDVPAAELRLLDADNPIRSIPGPPLGIDIDLASLPSPPTPERVRLGRWLFFDDRLSLDGTISCATCHRPEHAFSQTSPVATGMGGARGTRKVPTIINLAVPLPWSNFSDAPLGAFFWDGRARSLEQQALEPIANPVEMASSHARMVETIANVRGYRRYFDEAFGDPGVTKERVARAIADYVRTRMSGNSRFDRWDAGMDDAALSAQERRGFSLFSGPALCGRCHRPPLFTDGKFHNLGIGWNAETATFTDYGRQAVTKGTIWEADPGTFKTPTLREVTRHPPYMHDGSIATLREVVEFYNRGAIANPDLAFAIPRSGLGLAPSEIADIVAFLGALEGEQWQDAGPSRFPR